MSKKLKVCGEAGGESCENRREFLIRAGLAGGSLILSLSALKPVEAQSGDKKDACRPDDLIIKIDEKSALNQVGGAETLETKIGKLIVVRTSAACFSAVSAVCPHKGGPIKYDERNGRLYCPWHNSYFDTRGKVLNGPAETPLKSYGAQNAIVLTLESFS